MADYASGGWDFYAPNVIVGEVLYVLCQKFQNGFLFGFHTRCFVLHGFEESRSKGIPFRRWRFVAIFGNRARQWRNNRNGASFSNSIDLGLQCTNSRHHLRWILRNTGRQWSVRIEQIVECRKFIDRLRQFRLFEAPCLPVSLKKAFHLARYFRQPLTDLVVRIPIGFVPFEAEGRGRFSCINSNERTV